MEASGPAPLGDCLSWLTQGLALFMRLLPGAQLKLVKDRYQLKVFVTPFPKLQCSVESL